MRQAKLTPEQVRFGIWLIEEAKTWKTVRIHEPELRAMMENYWKGKIDKLAFQSHIRRLLDAGIIIHSYDFAIKEKLRTYAINRNQNILDSLITAQKKWKQIQAKAQIEGKP